MSFRSDFVHDTRKTGESEIIYALEIMVFTYAVTCRNETGVVTSLKNETLNRPIEHRDFLESTPGDVHPSV